MLEGKKLRRKKIRNLVVVGLVVILYNFPFEVGKII